jgi:hypothetical protein
VAVGDDPPPEATPSHMLGLTTLSVATGVAVGAYYGGVLGSIAGSFFGGAIVNAYRAMAFYRQGSPDGDHEAKVSATYALLAAAAGGYVSYKYVKPRHPGRFDENPAGGGDDDDGDQPTSCRPRPSGL